MGFVLGFSVLARAAFYLFVSVLPARLTMNSGETIEGQMVEIKAASIIFQSGSGTSELPFDDVLSLTSTKADDATGPNTQVALVDGTRIAAQDFSLRDEFLTIEPRRQNSLTVPLKQVKSIRFRAAAPLTDPQWLGLLDKPSRQDLLVIRRDGERLDPTEGIIESMGGGKVAFNLDGETVEAPTERLEGVVFGGAAVELAPTSIQVMDRYGSRWMATAIETSEDKKSLQLNFGQSQSHAIPLSHLQTIRWSGGLSLLASKKPADASYTPYLQTEVDGGIMKDWFGPTSSGEADVMMIGNSSIEYRLDDGYQTLAGAVRRDPEIDSAGDLVVRILLDDREVWNEKLAGIDTLGFELPVEGAKRLRIEVDSGADGDIGDRVIVVRPRMLK